MRIRTVPQPPHCSKQHILTSFQGTESKKIYPAIHKYLKSAQFFPVVKGDGAL